ncbi:MAG TPA: Trp biosynthesis-associated membrane protein [Micromonosporaceae bacterium]|nr:Trp biosynthesis-associated membrane protein [Micromonosporaceae bacterium]
MTGGRAPRRDLLVALLLCGAGAGLGFFAASRGWSVELIDRPAPLPATRVVRTGSDLLPWLVPLALVGLAGTGAVLATRGVARRFIGVLLFLVGLGLVAGGIHGVALPVGTGPAWPTLAAFGGLLAAGGGAFTLLRGHRWPGMGARYERRTKPGGTAGAASAGRVEARATIDAWDALDRGEDPTDRPIDLRG